MVVFRQINGERRAAAFDLATIRDGSSPNPVVYGNDIIVVDGSKLSNAYRQILQVAAALLCSVPLSGFESGNYCDRRTAAFAASAPQHRVRMDRYRA